MERIYLDYAATTPLDERVLEVMLPYFSDIFGNPSSTHFYGQRAEHAIETARQKIAQMLNCDPEEVIFTSGGSESDNLALRGIALNQRAIRNANHILVSPVEHPAVLQTARQLERVFGFELEFLPVNAYGQVDPEDVRSRLRPDTAVVSAIAANNEIGSINPILEIGNQCRIKGIPFHTDAVQFAAHHEIDCSSGMVDAISLGAHKFYGPKGVGVLYLRRGIQVIPVQTGGSQEYALRAGTSNTPLIVGMAEALTLVKQEMPQVRDRISPMRDRVIQEILERVPLAKLTGHPSQRLSNHASFVFKGVNGNHLLSLLDMAGFACSSGSACKSGNPKPSDVIVALGLETEWAFGSLRITLGRETTQQQIDAFLDRFPQILLQARK